MVLPFKLVPPVPEALGPSYTEMALKALDEARDMILKADQEGKPVTHLVVCMIAEFTRGKEERMVTQWVTSDLCGDLAALGVLDFVAHDMKGT